MQWPYEMDFTSLLLFSFKYHEVSVKVEKKNDEENVYKYKWLVCWHSEGKELLKWQWGDWNLEEGLPVLLHGMLWLISVERFLALIFFL